MKWRTSPSPSLSTPTSTSRRCWCRHPRRRAQPTGATVLVLRLGRCVLRPHPGTERSWGTHWAARSSRWSFWRPQCRPDRGHAVVERPRGKSTEGPCEGAARPRRVRRAVLTACGWGTHIQSKKGQKAGPGPGRGAQGSRAMHLGCRGAGKACKRGSFTTRGYQQKELRVTCRRAVFCLSTTLSFLRCAAVSSMSLCLI